MEGDGPQILGTGAKFKRVPYQKSCRVNRAIVKLLELCNREKMQHFTLMGDISKTYHRVLILEEDQHVHRFLWRNLETDGEPDPYVKTVLMFGEKPAPAMAQIAVKKNSGRESDFGSIDTVAQGQKLTGDLDKVLESEGFAVKGWTLKKVLTNIENQERGFIPRRS